MCASVGMLCLNTIGQMHKILKFYIKNYTIQLVMKWAELFIMHMIACQQICGYLYKHKFFSYVITELHNVFLNKHAFGSVYREYSVAALPIVYSYVF